MGDRTYCEIIIHEEDYKRNKEKLDSLGYEIKELKDNKVVFIDYEANYGDIDDLEVLLDELNLEYNKSWDKGDEYLAGSYYCRRRRGKLRSYRIDSSEESILEEIIEALKLEDPIKIKKALQDKIKELQPFEPGDLTSNDPKAIKFVKKISKIKE